MSVPDSTWAGEARAARQALETLGWPAMSRCLPGEPEAGECGGGFAQHAAAYYIFLQVIAAHQVKDHIGLSVPEIRELMMHATEEVLERCQIS